jgi:hypothetical protein
MARIDFGFAVAAFEELAARPRKGGKRRAGAEPAPADDGAPEGPQGPLWELPSRAYKDVLWCYLSHANHAGVQSHPAPETVARAAGVSARHLQRIRDRLETDGWLKFYGLARLKRSGGGKDPWERRLASSLEIRRARGGWMPMAAIDLKKIARAIDAHRAHRAARDGVEALPLWEAAMAAAERERAENEAAAELRTPLPPANITSGHPDVATEARSGHLIARSRLPDVREESLEETKEAVAMASCGHQPPSTDQSAPDPDDADVGASALRGADVSPLDGGARGTGGGEGDGEAAAIFSPAAAAAGPGGSDPELERLRRRAFDRLAEARGGVRANAFLRAWWDQGRLEGNRLVVPSDLHREWLIEALGKAWVSEEAFHIVAEPAARRAAQ